MGFLISQVMRFYGGALSYKDIMAMPYKAFMMLYEYMIWQLREQDEKGQKINKRIQRTDKAKAFGSRALQEEQGASMQATFDKIKNIAK